MNGPAVKIANSPADSHLVPAHSSGEKMFTHESMQGSKLDSTNFKIWSIDNDQISVSITIRIIIVEILFDNS